MQYLVFSDIHANAEALEQVADEVRSLRPDLVVSLGDVVGYGASPRECVEIVDSLSDIRVRGNHDHVAAGLEEADRFGITARVSIEWTRRELGPSHREKLAGYEPVASHGECLFAHSSPLSPFEWEYVYTIAQARRILGETSERFVFVGHTHVPGVISYGDISGCRVERSSIIQAEKGRRYLINTGSIGQPRDGVCAASFALVEPERGRINLRRVPYDVTSAQERIRATGLPDSLASRLVLAR